MELIIAKANNDVISWCECAKTTAAYPGQLDCPWCGCGWLFSCSRCHKSFTFGRMVKAEKPLAQYAEAEIKSRGWDIDDALVEDWVSYHEFLAGYLSAGQEVVYLDGNVFSTDTTDLEFKGWYAHHQLAQMPHSQRTAEALESILGDTAYWTERELPDRD